MSIRWHDKFENAELESHGTYDNENYLDQMSESHSMAMGQLL
jgi:hypothetical protein